MKSAKDVRRGKVSPQAHLKAVEPERLLALLGKPIEQPALRALLEPLGEPHRDDFKDSYYWSFYKQGLSLLVPKRGPLADRVRTFFLYARGTDDDFSPYPGPLPFGLTFKSRRGEVEERLGKPGQVLGEDTDDVTAIYPRLSLNITYRLRKGEPPAKARIADLRLARIEKRKGK